MVSALVAVAVVSGGVAAGAASPANNASPMARETCVSHHPEWSDAEAEAMTEAMQSGRVGVMGSMIGDGMGHMGWGR